MLTPHSKKYKFLKGIYYVLVFFLASGFSYVAFANPPGSAYSPGATLDPTCTPGSSNCTVSITPSGSDGYVQFSTSGALASDVNFFWDNTNKRLGIGTSSPATLLDVTGSNTSAVVGSEMISSAADRNFSSDTGNWTGTNWSIDTVFGEATHSIAGVNPFTLANSALSAAPIAGHTYKVSVMVYSTATSDTITPSIGGTSGLPIGKADYGTFTQIIVATDTSPLVFTPTAGWTGLVTSISVVEITPSSATQITRNSNSTIGLEIRSGGSGLNNSFVGVNSGSANSTGYSNSFFGSNAGKSNVTGDSNAFFGSNAGKSNVVGYRNAFFGNNAGFSSTNGGSNVFVGNSAGYSNNTGSYNIFVGASSGYLNTTGFSNIAIGESSFYSNTTGLSNIAIGNDALYSNTTGSSNTAIGPYALNSNTTGYGNTASGISALSSNTTGGYNVASGYNALWGNTTGSSNVGMGYGSLSKSTTGSKNVAVGEGALWFNASATSTTAVGYQAGYGVLNNANQNNALFGYRSGYGLSTGSNNTANGYQSLYSNTSGNFNSVFGYQSGYNITTGYDNILLGHDANTGGNAITTGYNNIGLGYNIKFPSSASSNMLNVGNFLFANLPATTTATTIGNTPLTGLLGVGTSSPYAKLSVWGANTLPTSKAFEVANSASSTLFTVLNSGDVGVGTVSPSYTLHVATTTVGGVVARFQNGTGYCDINPTTTALVCTSDATLKKDIVTIGSALDSVNALRGVTFRWLGEDETTQSHLGFIAQEVEKVLPELVATDAVSLKKSVNYTGFTPVLIEAVKELNVRLSSLESRIMQQVTSIVSGALANIKDLIVETITAHKVVTDSLEIKDSATNEVYCIKITNGEWDKSKGSCGSSQSAAVIGAASENHITLQIQGNNPATINVGDTYGDLGAIITSPESAKNYGIKASLDDGEFVDISQISVDTSVPGVHKIVYSVVDQNNATTTAERILNVVSINNTVSADEEVVVVDTEQASDEEVVTPDVEQTSDAVESVDLIEDNID